MGVDGERVALASFFTMSVLAGGNAVAIRFSSVGVARRRALGFGLVLGGLLVLAGVYVGALRTAQA
jgi:hypothetical protein